MPFPTQQEQINELLKFMSEMKNQQPDNEDNNIVLKRDDEKLSPMIIKSVLEPTSLSYDYIIEIIYFNKNNRLVVNSLDKDGVDTLSSSSVKMKSETNGIGIDENTPLVLRRKQGDNRALVYKTKNSEEKVILEYVGKKDIPTALIDKNFTKWELENEKSNIEDNNAPESISTNANETQLDPLKNNINVVKNGQTLFILFKLPNCKDWYINKVGSRENLAQINERDKGILNWLANRTENNRVINIEIDDQDKIGDVYFKDKKGKKHLIEVADDKKDILEEIIRDYLTKVDSNKQLAAQKSSTLSSPKIPPFTNQSTQQCNDNLNQKNSVDNPTVEKPVMVG